MMARFSTGSVILDFDVKRNGATYRGEFHQTDKYPQGGSGTLDWEVELQPEQLSVSVEIRVHLPMIESAIGGAACPLFV